MLAALAVQRGGGGGEGCWRDAHATQKYDTGIVEVVCMSIQRMNSMTAVLNRALLAFRRLVLIKKKRKKLSLLIFREN